MKGICDLTRTTLICRFTYSFEFHHMYDCTYISFATIHISRGERGLIRNDEMSKKHEFPFELCDWSRHTEKALELPFWWFGLHSPHILSTRQVIVIYEQNMEHFIAITTVSSPSKSGTYHNSYDFFQANDQPISMYVQCRIVDVYCIQIHCTIFSGIVDDIIILWYNFFLHQSRDSEGEPMLFCHFPYVYLLRNQKIDHKFSYEPPEHYIYKCYILEVL